MTTEAIIEVADASNRIMNLLNTLKTYDPLSLKPVKKPVLPPEQIESLEQALSGMAKFLDQAGHRPNCFGFYETD